MDTIKNIQGLLAKPLWQMTGEEFYYLMQNVSTDTKNGNTTRHERCVGVRELADKLNCCESTIYEMKRHGALQDAIISHIGKSICFDVDVAREAANRYIRNKRENNEEQ